MMVTFVSQCEKKALARTRRVLDAFADRIGDNTWQTVITQEGLLAVKKLLRKTASKNTAVACHWIRSRSRSELVWVVGRRDRFNESGRVPVNATGTDAVQFMDSDQWHKLDIITYAASIAGLFHDFGKANKLFQDKINPDVDSAGFEPYRHEWVSLRLFQSFVGDSSDPEWLQKLSDVKPDKIAPCFRDGVDGGITLGNNPLRFENLPPFARLVAWIILTHHRLPMVPAWKDNLNQYADLSVVSEWLDCNFDALWNSYRCLDEDQQDRVNDNWTFANDALPYYSSHWRAKACTLASEAQQKLTGWFSESRQDFVQDNLFVSHLARLSMMLADHHYSAQLQVTPQWRNADYKVYANTDRETRQYKQQLDEHLIGVATHAEKIVRQLPKFKRSLLALAHNELLSNPVPKQFKEQYGWQDLAVKEVRRIGKATLRQGFFGLNMASTGKGKTLANAKIMYSLGEDTGGVRFNVALGLRALTLQTGREYRKQLELSDEQLAILVGGAAVKQLFEASQIDEAVETAVEASGSESDQAPLSDDLFVDYSGAITDHSLQQWVEGNIRLEKLLGAPVLVSTIDHLMPATEGTRGGKQIGPMLRLLSSDLVLDEPDDFGLEDLPALCRLVHWSGLLGSRVLLSTATMPPALAFALFQAYKAGWSQYAKANIKDWQGAICCAWFDEFGVDSLDTGEFSRYKSKHESFVAGRLKRLAKNIKPKRIGQIAPIQSEGENAVSAMAVACHAQLCQLHRHHHVSQDTKRVSVGLIRMANINPLVAVAQALLKMPAPINTRIHYCIYHSRHPLAIRSYIENQLDKVLSRKDEDVFWQRPQIRDVVSRYPEVENHIFVVLASPVAEVGRDHDYDWMIAEVSSIRSLVQLAGRLLRHRHPADAIDHPNFILLDKNFKALNGNTVCFNRPGYESDEMGVASPILSCILPKSLYQVIDARPRIEMPGDIMVRESKKNNRTYRVFSKLNDLEHSALRQQLFTGEGSANVWWKYNPAWCGEIQRQQPFRRSEKDEAYFLYLENSYSSYSWRWLNEHVYPPKLGEVSSIAITPLRDLEVGTNCGLWFEADVLSIYSQLAETFSLELGEVSRRFGELRVTNYRNQERTEYQYHEALGLFQELDDGK